MSSALPAGPTYCTERAIGQAPEMTVGQTAHSRRFRTWTMVWLHLLVALDRLRRRLVHAVWNTNDRCEHQFPGSHPALAARAKAKQDCLRRGSQGDAGAVRRAISHSPQSGRASGMSLCPVPWLHILNSHVSPLVRRRSPQSLHHG